METRKNLLQALGDWWAEHQTQAFVERPKPTRPNQILRWFIPNGGTLLLVIALIATAQVWAKPFAAPNAPGPSATTVNYQGHLADPDGNPLDGTYAMEFAIYDDSTGGNLIWGPEEHGTIKVSDGLFSVGLGSETIGGIPTSVWNGDRYLEITVDNEVLSPRELIRSVPIAGMALTVPDGAVTNQQLALTRYEIPMSESNYFDLTDTEQVIGEEMFSISYPATYLVFLYYSANGHGGRSILYMRDADGNNLCNTGHTSDNVLNISRTCIFELPAGTHTFRLSARTASSDVGQEVRTGTHAILIPIAQAP